MPGHPPRGARTAGCRVGSSPKVSQIWTGNAFRNRLDSGLIPAHARAGVARPCVVLAGWLSTCATEGHPRTVRVGHAASWCAADYPSGRAPVAQLAEAAHLKWASIVGSSPTGGTGHPYPHHPLDSSYIRLPDVTCVWVKVRFQRKQRAHACLGFTVALLCGLRSSAMRSCSRSTRGRTSLGGTALRGKVDGCLDRDRLLGAIIEYLGFVVVQCSLQQHLEHMLET
jgi:hypothetical protein